MGIIAQIKEDVKDILNNSNEFGVTLSFAAPAPGNETATINGIHTKHHTAIDGETGLKVNSKNAHVSFSESLLTALSYPVRNGNDEVAMKGHRVTVDGITYKIMETKPDETIGVIVCILAEYE